MLDTLGLSAEQRDARILSLGGSDAVTIMSGNPEYLMKLWEEKALKKAPEDLSDILRVMMGNATEAFNAAWYSKQTGDSVTARNELRKHNTIEYMACNLDGLCLGETAVWEAKHTSDYDFGEREAKTIESLGQYYLPQLTHNMLVLGLEQARLSAFFGNGRWDYLTVELDPFYADALLEAEAKFWQCVKSDTPPVDLPAPPPPPAVDKMRIVDMEAAKSNAWAASASDFLVHKSAAKIFEDSKTNLKKLVDKDVKEAYGYGVRITRAKNGALTVKEDK